jgi:hypothetical protein
MVGILGWALGKIRSILTSDEQKNNVGLSLKFEVKALKVIDCKSHVFVSIILLNWDFPNFLMSSSRHLSAPGMWP